MNDRIKKREEIPQKYRWDLESVFATIKECEKALSSFRERVKGICRYQGRLSEDPDVLADFLEESDSLAAELGVIVVYASSRQAVEAGDQKIACLNDQARSSQAEMEAAIAFAQPEILDIDADVLKEWMVRDERLARYEHFFDRVHKRKDHLRSPEVESLLGMARDAFKTATATHHALTNADLKFQPAIDENGRKHVVAQGTIANLMTHADREVRRSAWENYADAHLAVKNTAANILTTGVKQNVFMARARGYRSSLEAALANDFMPTNVYHNMIDAFKRDTNVWRRYWAIRGRALGYSPQRLYDLKAPLSTKPPRISFETAVEWISEGMRPLGEEYVAILRAGSLTKRWIDVFPHEGKRTGAFSTGFKGTEPFIMVNYTKDLFGLSTLAHELGHSLHSHYAWRGQEVYRYTRYGLVEAEVASNFNQAMVRSHLLARGGDKEFQIAVIEEAMDNFHRYLLLMPTLARFELEIHERVERGQSLDADALIELMADLFSECHGDEVVIDRDRIGITWAQFGTHLFSNFYVYKYATGIAAAHALASNVLDGSPGAAENYLAFLKTGGSAYPLDALATAGIDMTNPEVIETAFQVLNDYVARLEALIDRKMDD